MPNPYRYMRICAWSGPLLLVILIIFWGILGRNIPPYSAALSAEEIAGHFREHTFSMRLGMIVTMFGGVLYTVWGMAITKVMEEVEEDNDILSRLQLLGAAFTTIILVIPPSLWLSAAFRPDTDPEIVRMLYDAGWILFDLAYSLTSMQFVAFGVCFLNDRREVPLLPKWVSWIVIWVGLMFVILASMPFFHDGPFSRSGWVNYWIEFTIFFDAMLIMCIFILRAISRLEREILEERIDG